MGTAVDSQAAAVDRRLSGDWRCVWEPPVLRGRGTDPSRGTGQQGPRALGQGSLANQRPLGKAGVHRGSKVD